MTVKSGKNTGLAALWVEKVLKFPRIFLALALLSLPLTLLYAVLTLSIDTDDKDMLSAELPFRKNDQALERAFPILDAGLIAIIEGEKAASTEVVARALVEKLRGETEVFRQVFYPPAMPFFRENGFLYLSADELEERVGKISEAAPLFSTLRKDSSYHGLAEVFERAFDFQAEQGPDQLEGLRSLMVEMAQIAEAFQSGTARNLSWRDLVVTPAEGGEERAVEVIVILPKLDFSGLSPVAEATKVLQDAYDDLPEELRGGTKLHLTGEALMFQEELESLEAGMGVIGLIALSAVALILWLGLGSWRAACALVLTLLVGLAWTGAFAALVVGTLNLISVAFAVLFIGLGVDFGIHFLARALAEDLDGETAKASTLRLIRGAGHCGPVLGLCAFSSALAFYSFLPTDYKGISELGLISGSSMFLALAATFTVLPAALITFGWRAREGGRGVALASVVLAGERMAAARPRLVLLIAIGVAIVATFQLRLIDFDDDPLSLRNPDASSVKVLKRFEMTPGVEPYLGQLLAKDLKEAEEVGLRLSALPEVQETRSILNLVPLDQKEKLDLIFGLSLSLSPVISQVPRGSRDEAASRDGLAQLIQVLARQDNPFPKEGAQLSEALGDFTQTDDNAIARLESLLLSDLEGLFGDLNDAISAKEITLETLPEELSALWLTTDGRARVEIRPALSLVDTQARRNFVAAVQSVSPDVSGTPVVITEAGRAVVTAFLEALVYAVTAIFLLIWWRLGSAVDALLVSAPLALAGLGTLALVGTLGWQLNFANVIVLPLLFGLGVDSAIHMVSRARGLGGDMEEGRTLKAILLSALTTIASFGALSFSAHPGTASMGQLLTVAILLGLVATLIVLPAMLELRKRLKA